MGYDKDNSINPYIIICPGGWTVSESINFTIKYGMTDFSKTYFWSEESFLKPFCIDCHGQI